MKSNQIGKHDNQRIVTGKDGETFYLPDHYESKVLEVFE